MQVATKLTIDFSTLLGPLFITWLCQPLLPLMLVQLVYEKEKRWAVGLQYSSLVFLSLWVVVIGACWSPGP